MASLDKMNTDTMDLDTMAEILCNLRGIDPNDDEAFEAIRAEIVRDKVTFIDAGLIQGG